MWLGLEFEYAAEGLPRNENVLEVAYHEGHERIRTMSFPGKQLEQLLYCVYVNRGADLVGLWLLIPRLHPFEL